jgi:hypothetical protein
MTVETRLRDAMADAVAPATPDTDHLVAVARRRGLGIRRRRQALGSVGIAAALTLAVAVPTAMLGNSGGQAPVAVGPGTSSGTVSTTATDPLSGRATAAALLHAVGQEAPGTATGFHGSAVDGAYADAYAFFRFTPDGSTTAGEVAVNVQPNFLGDDPLPGDAKRVREGPCESYMTRCTSTRLADGSRLITYDDRSSYGSGGIRRVASLYRPDGVRIVVSASNGYDVTERDEQVTRDQPVLTTAQLVAVATQPWWGPRLPAQFTTEGDDLTSYVGSGSSAIATGGPTPASK